MNPESLTDWQKWLNEVPDAVRVTWHDPSCLDGEFRVHNTALHLAALGHWHTKEWPSNSALVELLLKNGALPNLQNDDGDTPLHFACSIDTQSEENVRLLLKYGADPNITNKRGEFPLHYVAYAYGVNGKYRAIGDLLLLHGSQVDFDTAVYLGDVDKAREFLASAGLEQSRERRRLLHNAVMSQSTAMVELILSYGADPNPTKWGVNPLYIASGWDNAEIVKLLLNYGADPNPKRYKPLAAAQNKQDITRLLKEAAAK